MRKETSAWTMFALATTLLCVPLGPAQEPEKFAFVAGISDYFSKTMDDLDLAEKDARDVGERLKSMGFEVTPCLGTEAEREKLVAAFDRFVDRLKRVETTAIVIVMLSGHGQELPTLLEGRTGPVTEPVPYFCARDAVAFDRQKDTIDGLTEQEIEIKFGVVSLNRLLAGLETGNSLNNLLIVDACRNNPAKGKAPQITGNTIRNLPNGISALFSAKSNQMSWESVDEKVRNGVFTHFVLEGLKGRAANSRGQVTWLRLATFVSEEVPIRGPALAGARDRVQNPHFIISSDSNIVLNSAPAALIAPFSEREVAEARRAWAAAKNIDAQFTNSIGMKFRLIPPGTFQMGSPESELDSNPYPWPHLDLLEPFKQKTAHREDEFLHTVTISRPFFMGVHEVTIEQYAKVARDDIYLSDLNINEPIPVNWVTWGDAQRFIEGLNQRERSSGIKYRLPTEAEWEYACRAGSTTPFSFGQTLNFELANAQFFGDDPNGEKYEGPPRKLEFTVVGSFSANAFGLFDMHGNVREWCQDRYDPDFYQKTDGSTDPINESSGSARVVRGGSLVDNASACRSACRHYFQDVEGANASPFGFRVVGALD